ncbi:MAG TPA: alpha/beta fold hydrolase [Steroidobacteraceae bacterium]|jgi:pimeloyl-ACP methyl ester carboxylesterase|nr:alpha/beta fold hydrolase [Steroidobacteraceae bacterium]
MQCTTNGCSRIAAALRAAGNLRSFVTLGSAVVLCILSAAQPAAAGGPAPSAGAHVRAASGTAAGSGAATHVPAAIYTDPPADPAHPARMEVLHVPSHGVEINGLLYAPPGAGLHPTFVFCHGLPGNEKNLDLAQAVRRAGWNAVAFNYRGSWGSPGSFRFTQNPEDAEAVLEYLRKPAVAAKLGIDVNRIVLAGHSMGGWVTAVTAARDKALLGAVLISMGDMGAEAAQPRKAVVDEMADNMESLAGVTAESMADEAMAHSKEFRTENFAEGLTRLPLLVLTANDGLAGESDDLVQAIKAKGGTRVTTLHAATDHSWSDHRIALESEIIRWLEELPAR